MRGRRSIRIYGVFAAVLVLMAQSVAVEAAPVRFGSKLTNSNGSVVQPTPARRCDNGGPHQGDPCTIVSLRAKGYNVGTKEKAPKDGTIHKVRVVSLFPGSFRLFFARAHPGSDEARVVKKGPIISFNGDNSSPYTIEVKSVSISVKKGWYIAARSSTFGTTSCTSGSQVLMEFQPPLVVGDPYQTEDDHNGCYLLVQLQY